MCRLFGSTILTKNWLVARTKPTSNIFNFSNKKKKQSCSRCQMHCFMDLKRQRCTCIAAPVFLFNLRVTCTLCHIFYCSFYVCFLVLYVCFLFCVICVFCVVFCIVSPFVYSALFPISLQVY